MWLHTAACMSCFRRIRQLRAGLLTRAVARHSTPKGCWQSRRELNAMFSGSASKCAGVGRRRRASAFRGRGDAGGHKRLLHGEFSQKVAADGAGGPVF